MNSLQQLVQNILQLITVVLGINKVIENSYSAQFSQVFL